MAIDAVSRIKDRSTQDEHKLRLRVPTQRRSELRFAALPALHRIVSVSTGEENRASVGDFIRIVGKNLSFDPNDLHSGVFFVDYGETRSAYYAHIASDLVIARVPDGLSSGPYLIRIRSAANGAEPRESRTTFVFSVE